MLNCFLKKLFGKYCCSQEDRMIYQVCGSDKFAETTFVVDQFDSKDKAEKKLKECRDSVMSQPESLRDSFWISETTSKQLQQYERREKELREARLAAQSYDREMLREDAKYLLQGLAKQLSGRHITPGKEHDAEFLVMNQSPKMCYRQILLGASGTVSGGTYIDLEIQFKDGGKIGSALLFFKSEAEQRVWMETKESLAETISILEDRIKEYFEI